MEIICQSCGEPIYEVIHEGELQWAHEDVHLSGHQAAPKLYRYAVAWGQPIEAINPEEAARQAYDVLMRPGALSHKFRVSLVTIDTPGEEGI